MMTTKLSSTIKTQAKLRNKRKKTKIWGGQTDKTTHKHTDIVTSKEGTNDIEIFDMIILFFRDMRIAASCSCSLEFSAV